ncbi:MAG: Smr/MutS family protein [Prevotellaceae bacterium]|jgi:DNA mismatch repair protein MutS2|nr:Smr/MutS family protein [Prevotellaceae bacterium]
MSENIKEQNFEQKIGFDIVRQNLKSLCVNFLSYEQIDKIVFLNKYESIAEQLDLAGEMMEIMNENINSVPLSFVKDLRIPFSKTQIEGTFLEISEVFSLKKNLENLSTVVKFFLSKNEANFLNLIKLSQNITLFPEILRKIDKILDKTGDIKPNATPELAKIYSSLQQTKMSVSKTLLAILKKAQEEGIIEADSNATMRDGRLVIPVPAMNKRRIAGIIHDESATGKTSFIEPSQVVSLNNCLRELENEQKREIIKILTAFTNFARQYYDDIEQSMVYTAKIDALCAISKYSIKIKAICPGVSKKPLIDWGEARHPVLQELLEKQGKKIVPLNIALSQEQRILIISGANAGGKSVSIKTAGLLQYMLQCGLPIPVAQQSRAGIFESIFIDIGDGQNIENDLSTYSSHLQNMKYFLKKANNKTLIIIDEFGSGTEPQTGAAIAQAILEEFCEKDVFALITTHYTNLKHFASETNGVVNAAMLYDKNRLEPLFVLQTGIPGSSFAVEIARKIGLPDKVVENAVKLIGTEQLNFDKNYQSAARDKRYWENKRRDITAKEKKKEEMIAEYQRRIEDLDKQKKDIIQQAKIEAKHIVQEANAAIENTIRTIKEGNAEKQITQKARAELTDFKTKLTEKKEGKKNVHKFQNGDFVVIKGQSIIGQIVDIKDKNAIVVFGSIQTRTKLLELDYVSKNQAKKDTSAHISKQTINAIRNKQLEFSRQIDVRGMRVDEALNAVIYFVDDAQVANVSNIRILHGLGEGALRQAIRGYLSTCPAVKKFADEHVQFGGAGITVVEL